MLLLSTSNILYPVLGVTHRRGCNPGLASPNIEDNSRKNNVIASLPDTGWVLYTTPSDTCILPRELYPASPNTKDIEPGMVFDLHPVVEHGFSAEV